MLTYILCIVIVVLAAERLWTGVNQKRLAALAERVEASNKEVEERIGTLQQQVIELTQMAAVKDTVAKKVSSELWGSQLRINGLVSKRLKELGTVGLEADPDVTNQERDLKRVFGMDQGNVRKSVPTKSSGTKRGPQRGDEGPTGSGS